MQFGGFYNFGGGGTEEITGGSNENVPSYEENVCTNDRMFVSGQFSNLSRELIHITLKGFGSAETFHKHDLRPYESLNVKMIPLKSIGVHVPSGKKIGFHGMGLLWSSEDLDEYAVLSANSSLTESLHNSPDFNTDIYKDVQITSATTTTIWTPSTDTDIGLYKLTISSSGANTVKMLWTDSAGANPEYIGLVRFSGEGTFVYDFDASTLRNPHRQNGLLKAITSGSTTVDIQAIGHNVHASQ
jgi:hypothetical protein|tara:strand:- start:4608 stop:5336 length:729 start_codon:yes stop_codon:yes gene_type:complete